MPPHQTILPCRSINIVALGLPTELKQHRSFYGNRTALLSTAATRIVLDVCFSLIQVSKTLCEVSKPLHRANRVPTVGLLWGSRPWRRLQTDPPGTSHVHVHVAPFLCDRQLVVVNVSYSALDSGHIDCLLLTYDVVETSMVRVFFF